MRDSKNIKIFINYFLGPALFVWLCFSIYRQVVAQQHLLASWAYIQQTLASPQIIYLVLAFLLMGFNWGLEAVKWKILVRDVHAISITKSVKAVLSGVAISVTTPNRVGEYLGRMMYMPEGKRLKVIAVSLIGSISQLLVTLVFGALGLLFLKDVLQSSGLVNPVFFKPFLVGLLLMILALNLFYFNLSKIERWIEKTVRRPSWLFLIQAVREFGMQRLFFILLLSLVRYGTFIVQYLLLFWLFNVQVPAGTLFWLMSLVFLTLAILPTIAVVVEFGIRGEVCLLLVGLFSTNNLGIVLTSVTIWVINLIIPALIGSLLILSIKIFKRGQAAPVAAHGINSNDEKI